MGIEGNRLYGAVRISFGYDLSIDTVTYAAQKICFEVSRLRKLALE
jgi:cysteine desulfurase